MTSETLHRWQSMRGPKSRWRQEARATMIRVVREQRDLGRLDDDAVLLKAVDAAYPFGERRYLPYKAWLTERRLLRAVLALAQPPAEAPPLDEIAACLVASDMLEEDPSNVARAEVLLREQAPNRLARRCPVCNARPGKSCVELVDTTYEPTSGNLLPFVHGPKEQLVPHWARLTGHLDAGPLFTSTTR